MPTVAFLVFIKIFFFRVECMLDISFHESSQLIMLLWLLQVKFRTANGGSYYGSHVLEFGDKELGKDKLYFYMGTNPANDNFTRGDSNSLRPMSKAVNQRDADLVHFWEKVFVLQFYHI